MWRYPVKSMRGEELPAVEQTEYGLLGDRAYAVVQGGTITRGDRVRVGESG